MICLCCALFCHLAAFLESNIRAWKCPVIQKLCFIFTARCRTRTILWAALRVLQCIGLQSFVRVLKNQKTGTMSSATLTENTTAERRQASCHSLDYWIIKVVIPSNPNAQYSNPNSKLWQYISSVTGPELMINVCPHDYPGIYAVKNSQSEHFNDRIFIKRHQSSSCISSLCIYSWEFEIWLQLHLRMLQALRCEMQMKLCDAPSNASYTKPELLGRSL